MASLNRTCTETHPAPYPRERLPVTWCAFPTDPRERLHQSPGARPQLTPVNGYLLLNNQCLQVGDHGWHHSPKRATKPTRHPTPMNDYPPRSIELHFLYIKQSYL